MALFDIDTDTYLLTAAAVVGAFLVLKHLLAPKPRYPPAPKPYGVFDDEGILWNRDSVGECRATLPGVATTYDLMKAAVAKGGASPTAGKRPIVKRHWVEHGGRRVEKLTLADEYEWISYTEFGVRMHELGAGMVSVGALAPNDCVIIYAETAREWMLAAQGAYTQGLVVVTVYATLGEEGFLHGAMQTKAKLVVADAKLLRILANVFRADGAKLRDLKKVVYIPDEPLTPDPVTAAATDEAVRSLQASGVEVLTMAQLQAKGRAAKLRPRAPAPDDLAVIMYTSGTTGKPKGVKISHANVVATAAGLLDKMPQFAIRGYDDVYLAYLPLAHIMELAAELMGYAMGMKVGYGSPHTLTPTGVKVMPDTCLGDAQALKPTLMVFAPAVLDKVYTGLNTKMKGASPVVQYLFKAGLEAGIRNFDCGGIGAPWLYNKLIFKKVQALLGGNIKACVTGSAPLSPGIQKFAQTAFNCPVRQGYGLTETCASSCIGEACDNSTGVVGPPTTATCIKLRDWAEGNYLLADAKDPAVGMPRGEILIGGPMVCQGYLVDPADPDPEVVVKNKTEFEVDANGTRWFCTGDIGQVTKDGVVQIIDRKKDLVKLQQGEYVALSKVESYLKMCPLVEIPMCYAESTKDYCIALICPSHLALKALAKTMGVHGEVEALCEHPAIVAEVSKQCLAACKGKLVGFETPKKFALIADTFTPENEILTAALKLKRPEAKRVHEKLIRSIYT